MEPAPGGPQGDGFCLRRALGRILRARRGVCPFLQEGAVAQPALARTPSTMENIVIGLIAVAGLAYLVVAVLRPEKF
jgi:K+-transporting ATPase KdpF subunit